ncbi:MAG: putative sulfate exporter family transporter [Chloroflexota bacterium]|nr:putative sulfate exporter family transporter [Chloroflexota bacterium]
MATGIGLLAWGGQQLETALLGQPLLEGLVLAILLGMLVRTLWLPRPRWQPGIAFTAKQILETAIVLLGASVSLPVLFAAGPLLGVGIVLVVVLGITASMTIGRLLGLPPRLAILVACGNSICGNSAIAAVAPVIGAQADEIAAAIALTAVIGVGVVLGLPLLIPLLHYSFYQYGVLAGMTVYAVPQVLAATFPVSALSGQVGTLVKLVRVLMLGPVVVFFGLRAGAAAAKRPALHKLVPWFIIGFLGLATLRSLGLLPTALADPLRTLAGWLTVAAMAALGLGVDIRALRQVGGAVAGAVLGSLAVLLVISVTLIWAFGIH